MVGIALVFTATCRQGLNIPCGAIHFHDYDMRHDFLLFGITQLHLGKRIGVGVFSGFTFQVSQIMVWSLHYANSNSTLNTERRSMMRYCHSSAGSNVVIFNIHLSTRLSRKRVEQNYRSLEVSVDHPKAQDGAEEWRK